MQLEELVAGQQVQEVVEMVQEQVEKVVEKDWDHQEAIGGELVEVVYEAQMEQVAHWAHFGQFLELGTPPFPHQTQEVIPSEVMVVREQQKWREVQEEPWKGQGSSAHQTQHVLR